MIFSVFLGASTTRVGSPSGEKKNKKPKASKDPLKPPPSYSLSSLFSFISVSESLHQTLPSFSSSSHIHTFLALVVIAADAHDRVERARLVEAIAAPAANDVRRCSDAAGGVARRRLNRDVQIARFGRIAGHS